MVCKHPKFPYVLAPLITKAKHTSNKEDFFRQNEGTTIKNISIDHDGIVRYKKKIPIRELKVRETVKDNIKVDHLSKVSSKEIPPIDIIGTKNHYYILDGHHRVLAAKKRGDKMIDAIITPTRKTQPIRLIDIYFNRDDLCDDD